LLALEPLFEKPLYSYSTSFLRQLLLDLPASDYFSKIGLYDCGRMMLFQDFKIALSLLPSEVGLQAKSNKSLSFKYFLTYHPFDLVDCQFHSEVSLNQERGFILFEPKCKSLGYILSQIPLYYY